MFYVLEKFPDMPETVFYLLLSRIIVRKKTRREDEMKKAGGRDRWTE